MNIKLTEEQRTKIDLVFKTLDELRKDKKFMKLLKECTGPEFDEEMHITEENEKDIMDIINFYDNLRDYNENYFNTWE